MNKGAKEILGGEFVWNSAMSEGTYYHSVSDIAMKYYPGFHHQLTGGGYYSLKAILLHLKAMGKTRYPVLLPAFLCPTILKPFRELNIPFRFYPVDVHLNPEFFRMDELFVAPDQQVLLFIPYFGFSVPSHIYNQLLQLQSDGVTLIEDRAQSLFPGFEPLGDYLFYSFRKFLPVDGSLLLSKYEMNTEISHDNQFYTSIRKEAQDMRYKFIHANESGEEFFLELFRQAEAAYYQEGIAAFEMTNLAVFTMIDIEKEVVERRRVWGQLNDLLPGHSVFRDAELESSSPLCFPVVVKQRDQVKNFLASHRIYAPVHWDIDIQDVPASFFDAHHLSSHLLSLPVRSEMTTENCRWMADLFIKAISLK